MIGDVVRALDSLEEDWDLVPCTYEFTTVSNSSSRESFSGFVCTRHAHGTGTCRNSIKVTGVYFIPIVSDFF